MADQGGQQQANGSPSAPDLLQRPSNAGLAQARIRQSRAATLAALEGAELGDAPAKPAPKVEAKAPSPAPAPEPELEADASDAPSDAGEGAGDDAKPEPKPEPKDAKADPEESKRLAAIQAAEKKSRERIQRERAEVAAEREALTRDRAALDAERAEIAALKKARERASLDPLGYLEAAGVTDFEYISKQAYARAKGATDPNAREQAARLMREREHGSELEQVKSELAKLQQQLVAREEAARFEADKSTYLEHAITSIGDDAPITRSLAAKNPAKLRAALWSLTERLAIETGDVPDVEDVIATYERSRREELDELGAAIPTQTPKQNTPAADKKNPAKTLAPDLSTPRVPRPKSSEREHRAETLALLESGRLE